MIFKKDRWTQLGIQRHLIEVEGGSVNHADDAGGQTYNGGVTKETLEDNKALWAKHGYTGGTVIPEGLIHDIYDTYWDKMHGDKLITISPVLIDCMMGWALNSGTVRPMQALQDHLNIFNRKGKFYADQKADGFMGKNTWDALVYLMENEPVKYRPIMSIVETISWAQGDFYREITLKREANESFIRGWHKRLRNKLASYEGYLDTVGSYAPIK